MDKYYGCLTVFFEEPFWVGVFERIESNQLTVSKVTFGAEPKAYEIMDFIRHNYHRLKFSSPVEVSVRHETLNPKRLQREARMQTLKNGIGTKSQQALQLQREMNKQERKTASKEEKEEKKKLQYVCKQQKRKKKHRGK